MDPEKIEAKATKSYNKTKAILEAKRNLEELCLAGNQIAEINGLGNLTELWELNLWVTK